jgi:V/A-type H+-transporting ATPase subunit A
MLKVILGFISLAEAALARGVPPQTIAELDILRRVQRMGEEIGEDHIDQFAGLATALGAAMAALGKAAPDAA